MSVLGFMKSSAATAPHLQREPPLLLRPALYFPRRAGENGVARIDLAPCVEISIRACADSPIPATHWRQCASGGEGRIVWRPKPSLLLSSRAFFIAVYESLRG